MTATKIAFGIFLVAAACCTLYNLAECLANNDIMSGIAALITIAVTFAVSVGYHEAHKEPPPSRSAPDHPLYKKSVIFFM